MKLLWSFKNKITKDKHGGNAPHLEFAEVVLIHCKTVNSYYQHNSGVSHTFVPSKHFGHLLNIFPKNV